MFSRKDFQNKIFSTWHVYAREILPLLKAREGVQWGKEWKIITAMFEPENI